MAQIMQWYPELRPEEHTAATHANALVQRVRTVLWTEELLKQHPLGSEVPFQTEKLRPGFLQVALKRQLQWIAPLPEDVIGQAAEFFAVCAAIERKSLPEESGTTLCAD